MHRKYKKIEAMILASAMMFTTIASPMTAWAAEEFPTAVTGEAVLETEETSDISDMLEETEASEEEEIILAAPEEEEEAVSEYIINEPEEYRTEYETESAEEDIADQIKVQESAAVDLEALDEELRATLPGKKDKNPALIQYTSEKTNVLDYIKSHLKEYAPKSTPEDMDLNKLQLSIVKCNDKFIDKNTGNIIAWQPVDGYGVSAAAYVTLQYTYDTQTYTSTKKIYVYLGKNLEEYNENIKKCYEELSFDKIRTKETDTEDYVTEGLWLPSYGNQKVNWSTDRPDILELPSNGVCAASVNRGTEDQQVTLTAQVTGTDSMVSYYGTDKIASYTKSFHLTVKKLPSASFKVTDSSGKELNQYTVSVKDETGNAIKATDEAGKTFNLWENKPYIYTVSAEGYVTVTDTVTVDGTKENTEVPVALKKISFINFKVTDSSGKMIEKYTVTLKDKDGSEVTASDEAGTTFKLSENMVYTYTVSAEGYGTATGTVTATVEGTTELPVVLKGNQQRVEEAVQSVSEKFAGSADPVLLDCTTDTNVAAYVKNYLATSGVDVSDMDIVIAARDTDAEKYIQTDGSVTFLVSPTEDRKQVGLKFTC